MNKLLMSAIAPIQMIAEFRSDFEQMQLGHILECTIAAFEIAKTELKHSYRNNLQPLLFYNKYNHDKGNNHSCNGQINPGVVLFRGVSLLGCV